jgi:pantoate--beta-alanine ligase
MVRESFADSWKMNEINGNMRTIQQISAVRAFVQAARSENKIIGFVPTMGALHEGHLSLLHRAKNECDVVILSIFVNPTQFLPNEDFERYPRDLIRDSRLAQEIGTDALFAPSVEEMYPNGCLTSIDVPELSNRLEGAIRPGHFRGVATICAKLFHIVQPHRAYFGQKDYQQYKIVDRMVHDLNLTLTVVSSPIIREPDGLALSSRNVYLSQEERRVASTLYKSLQVAEALFHEGENNAETLEESARSVLRKEPLIQVQYMKLVDTETLDPIQTVESKAVLLAAIKLGSTRLIDNIILSRNAEGNHPKSNGAAHD